ncbi:MAG: sodium:solute symporter [Candidatus Binatia bacterium]
MRLLDWLVLAATLAAIVAYGIWRTRGIASSDHYLRGGNADRWPTIGLSIMATQASAITFLSTPGQAYEDGLRFVQFYFGLPIAMVILSAVMLPAYYRLHVITAYEFLEQRFDLKTRQLAAFLFLVQRGLAAGITIYAPSILLSSLLGWPLTLTSILTGGLVILYTVAGGTRAVSQTQKQQMTVMLFGMAAAAAYIVASLPPAVSFGDALHVAGALGRLNALDFSLDTDSRYTFWSGITGGTFLALAYFGTDQSQVQRYLSGQTLAQSRLGLLMNGLLKVPMQFLILMTGVLVFVFYQFEKPPAFFNEPARNLVAAGEHRDELLAAEGLYDEAHAARRRAVEAFLEARRSGDAGQLRAADDLRAAHAGMETARRGVKTVIAADSAAAKVSDTDYVFLGFVLRYLPAGLVGLVIAVVISAAMSSTASELSALGTTTLVDFYRRSWVTTAPDFHYLRMSRVLTAAWGLVAVAFACFASLLDNLIEAVNIVGSLFYGSILGIFLAAIFLPRVGGTAVFVAALAAEAVVLFLYVTSNIGFLWFNAIGCGIVLAAATMLSVVMPRHVEGRTDS